MPTGCFEPFDAEKTPKRRPDLSQTLLPTAPSRYLRRARFGRVTHGNGR